MSTFNKAVSNIIKASGTDPLLRVSGPVKVVLNNVIVGGVQTLSESFSATTTPLFSASFVSETLRDHFEAPDEVLQEIRTALVRFTAAEKIKGESSSARAGLLLPTARIRTLCRASLPPGTRVAEQALVATAAYLEYVTREIWLIGARATVAAKKKTVSLELLHEGICANAEGCVSRMLLHFRLPPEIVATNDNDKEASDK